jgi:putative MATE family efflux protein
MHINLSEHFTYKKLLRFTMPSILMMIFTSIYCVVDGFFVSNFAGDTALAAVNFIYPVLMILGSIGFMFGAGGSALIGKTLGEGHPNRANRLFSLFVYSTIVCGIALGGVGLLIIEPVAKLMGATGELLNLCVDYAQISLCALPFYMLQFEFQSFFIAAEKPHLGLVTTLCAGCTNMALDALFVGVFSWGVHGAALATGLSQAIGAIIPLVYFFRQKNSSLLRLGKTRFDGQALLKATTNGSSELMSNIAMSLVGMLYNVQLLKLAGQNGVAAYGVLMYVGMIFNAVFIGYAVGVAPVVSFHFGAENKEELRGLLKKSSFLIGISSLLMFILSEALAYPLAKLYVGYDSDLLDMTHRAFLLFSTSYHTAKLRKIPVLFEKKCKIPFPANGRPMVAPTSTTALPSNAGHCERPSGAWRSQQHYGIVRTPTF